ncbi:beta-ketoacyl synthase N-terminal-like domain-containing protein [Streptomyces finlayi]|nr:beta-ketoacyl synthase N-terminal-like domain-containing protein [Streptomyces finlayi]
MAWSTALGDDLTETWSALRAGRDGFREVPSDRPLRNRLAADIPGLPHTLTAARRMHLLTVRTVEASLKDAGAAAADCRLVAGTSFGALLDTADDGDPAHPGAEGSGDIATGGVDTGPVDPGPVGPGGGPPPHTWPRSVAEELGLRTPVLPVSSACSTASDALAAALTLLARDPDTPVVCGAADVLTPAKRLGHTALATMSPDRIRPFDRRRDGMLLGEGAGFLVLESPQAARRRSARVHGRLLGAGASNDGAGLTTPNTTGAGVARAIRAALREAGVAPDEVGAVAAHGTGTRLNDLTEARALNDVFDGVSGPPVVFALKSQLGHTLGATGVLQTIALLLALRDRAAPPVAHLTEPDPALRLPLALPGSDASPLPAGEKPCGLVLTLGFGGFNTCLVVDSRST